MSGLRPSDFVPQDRPSLGFDHTKVVYDPAWGALLQGFTRISFSFFTPTIAIYAEYNTGSAFDLDAQYQLVKSQHLKAV